MSPYMQMITALALLGLGLQIWLAGRVRAWWLGMAVPAAFAVYGVHTWMELGDVAVDPISRLAFWIPAVVLSFVFVIVYFRRLAGEERGGGSVCG